MNPTVFQPREDSDWTKDERLARQTNPEGYFQTQISPIPEDAIPREGRGDWRVVVQRLSDGKTRCKKVSGDWALARMWAEKLCKEFDKT